MCIISEREGNENGKGRQAKRDGCGWMGGLLQVPVGMYVCDGRPVMRMNGWMDGWIMDEPVSQSTASKKRSINLLFPFCDNQYHS